MNLTPNILSSGLERLLSSDYQFLRNSKGAADAHNYYFVCDIGGGTSTPTEGQASSSTTSVPPLVATTTIETCVTTHNLVTGAMIRQTRR
jgi:hypothetical protein